MARIPDEAINHIKQSTDIIALIQSRGTNLKQKGQNWIGLCPFHNDTNTPNLIVTPSKGLFRCMAADCAKAGNAIQFLQYHDGLSFRHAFELLDKGGRAAFENVNTNQPKKSQTVKLECPVDPEEENLLERVSDYYHSRLNSPDGQAALEHLKTRGLDLPEETLTRFRIGVSDRTIGLRIPHSRTVKGQAIRQQLVAHGVYRKKTKREHLYCCLTVPITNLKNETVQIYGRRIARCKKEERHLYLAKKQEGIFNPSCLKNRHELILCESILDALTFYHHGMENVTCTYGTSNQTDELLEAIKAAKIETVKLAFDADHSGEIATTKVSKTLQSLGIQVCQIKFPWGSDANQYAQDQGKEALKTAVRNAVLLDLQRQESSHDESLDESCAPSSLVANKAANLAAELRTSDQREAECKPLAAFYAAKEKNVLEQNESSSLVVELKTSGDYHTFQLENRSYRVGGLHKNNTLDVLRITLRITHDSLLHVDSLDLYRDGERRKYIDRASEETLLSKDLLKRDIGKLLLALEQHQEERLKAPAEQTESKELTAEEESKALELLKSENLLDQITEAYDKAGIVGEKTNKLATYLACVSIEIK